MLKPKVKNATEIKKILKQVDKDTLIELLADCYKLFPVVKEYINIKYSEQDAIEQIFENYKNRIHDIFFPKSMKTQFKISDAKKLVSDFKKICKDEKLLIDLMLYIVEMGVEFTNAYGDIDESFYNSIERMYHSVVEAINEQKNQYLFNEFMERLKAVVDDTRGIGWGFHDCLDDMYRTIAWLKIDDVNVDLNELEKIKEFVYERLEKRNDIVGFYKDRNLRDVIEEIINTDEVFLNKVEKIGSYCDDDKFDYILKKTNLDTKFIELVLWQKYCYEMKNDDWQHTQGKCSKCGSKALYMREIPDMDFEDKIVCRDCGTVLVGG